MGYFKYTSLATGLAVLTARKLRWSTAALLNDPYDIQFDLHVQVDDGAVKRRVLQRLWDAHYGPSAQPAANTLGTLISAFRGQFPRLSRADFDAEYGAAIDKGLLSAARNRPQHQQEIRNFMADVKILCLSETADNVLMWAHYS